MERQEQRPSLPLSLCFPPRINGNEEPEADELVYRRYDAAADALPADRSSWGFLHLKRYGGCWFTAALGDLQGAMATRDHFVARRDDVLLVTLPKSGTTWLKALAFSTLYRSGCGGGGHLIDPASVLLTANPHECVPFLELQLYAPDHRRLPDIDALPSPRLLATHLPLALLPASAASDAKIVYLLRDPRDVFISAWHFANSLRPRAADPIDLEGAFDAFCRGIHVDGPFWEHALGYWKASQEAPERVLFMRYEDIKRDAAAQVRRLAEFMGRGFQVEEDERGVVERILELCNFERMKGLEVNQTGKTGRFKNRAFFRKGEVGDWANHLSPEMARRLDRLVEDKFAGSGLSPFSNENMMNYLQTKTNLKKCLYSEHIKSKYM